MQCTIIAVDQALVKDKGCTWYEAVN